MMWRALMLAAVVLAFPAGAAWAEPDDKWHVTDAVRPGAERDYALLKDRCRDLFSRYAGDVESVEVHAPATYRPANDPATYIRVRIADDARLIPATYRAWGHTLHYYVRDAGVSTQKDQSRQVCGWPALAPAGHDAFYPFAGDQLAEALVIGLLSPPAAAETPRYFREWCDAFTAQGLVSLAANRIFGYISTLDDEQYEARRAWVNEAHALAAARFQKLTGQELLEFEFEVAQPSGWVPYCQLAGQIE